MAVHFQTVLNFVAQYREVSIADIKGPLRTARIMEARLEVYFLARELTDLSFPRIGMLCGDRDHTTVASGVRKVEQQVRTITDRAIELQAFCVEIRHIASLTERAVVIPDRAAIDPFEVAARVAHPKSNEVRVTVDEIRAMANTLADFSERGLAQFFNTPIQNGASHDHH